MQRYEYRVMPAPRKADKVKGAKTTEDRFAASLTAVMNELGAQGWEYLRADTLPCEERTGLTGSKTTFQTLLVFRRPLPEPEAERPVEPVLPLPAPPAPPEPAAPVRRPTPLWLGKAEAAPGAAPALGPAAPRPATEE
jgi:hypothetical protein